VCLAVTACLAVAFLALAACLAAACLTAAACLAAGKVLVRLIGGEASP